MNWLAAGVLGATLTTLGAAGAIGVACGWTLGYAHRGLVGQGRRWARIAWHEQRRRRRLRDLRRG